MPLTLDRRALLKGATALSAHGLLATPGAALAAPAPARQSAPLDACTPEGIDLVIARQTLRIAGKKARPLTLNGGFPGPTLHMKQGEQALIRVHNTLDEPTSIHWHGILVPFDMDGVPGISFAGIAPGETFTYRYTLDQSGTYWYHSHTGFQEQLGLYGQLVVAPADTDPVAYDVQHSVVLSDWTFQRPHQVFENLKKFEGYYNFQRPTLANLDDQMRHEGKTLKEAMAMRLRWRRMRMDPTDLLDVTGAAYTYLVNGHSPEENALLLAKPGERVRLRLTNASSMTYFDVRIPGLAMTVVQADGQDIVPVETDELRIAVAETYDVIVTLPEDRAYTFFAEAMDRSGHARATLAPRAGMSAPVPPRRPRPMLSMADMGMMMSHGDMKMDGMNMQHDMKAGDSGMTHGMDHDMKHDMSAGETMSQPALKPGELPVSGLPKQVPHGEQRHGPGSITMARNLYRQLDEPGPGLGNDGWRVLTYRDLRALHTPPDRRPPTREIDLHLTGNMERYVWGFDGISWSDSKILRFVYGERLRINFYNDTMMNHPIHLHGMWMDLYAEHPYGENPRKHTVNVQPAELLTVDITVDAPGQWAFHCHLLYHMEAGMFRTVGVVKSLEGEAADAKG